MLVTEPSAKPDRNNQPRALAGLPAEESVSFQCTQCRQRSNGSCLDAKTNPMLVLHEAHR